MLHLVDDGTLDTVLHCDECDKDLRYSSENNRKEDGSLLPEWWESVESFHKDECELEDWR